MGIVIPGYEDLAENSKRSFFDYHDNTYNIVSRVAFLIGVEKRHFENVRETPDLTVYKQLQVNKNARIIRNLCMLRTALERNYKQINDKMRYELKNLHTLPELVPQDSLTELENDGISIIKANTLPVEYIRSINILIAGRIGNVKNLFPDWLNWNYIKDLFIMPDGKTDNGMKAAAAEYYANCKSLPYQCYINFPVYDKGNILYTDLKFVKTLYEYHEDVFGDTSKVTDAGEKTKSEIYDFLERSDRIIIAVDCENSDPIKFQAMLNTLDKEGLQNKICKIVLYDDRHTTAGWNYIDEFTKIEVQYEYIERIKEHKSLADVKLTAGICKEYYEHKTDAVILASSDSDFWGLISAMPEIKFYVLVESGKVSREMKEVLEANGYSYCYIDNFCTGNTHQLKQRVLLDYLTDQLEAACSFNIREIVDDAYRETRITMTDKEKKQFYDRYIKNMSLKIDRDGEVQIELGK